MHGRTVPERHTGLARAGATQACLCVPITCLLPTLEGPPEAGEQTRAMSPANCMTLGIDHTFLLMTDPCQGLSHS